MTCFRKKYYRIQLRFIFLLFLFFLISSFFLPLPANAASIEMELALGFNGIFRLKDWTPLTVVLENRHQGLQGRLEVVVTSGSEYQNDVYYTTYSADVDLPTYSKKNYAFTIRIDSYVHPLIIQLKKGNEIILSKSINLRDHYTTKPLLIFADDKPEDLSPQITENYQPVHAPVHFFPETWFGYQGVKAVFLKAGMWNDLKTKQYQEIIRWIKSGGYVVTIGSLDNASSASERLERLMSLRVIGFERVRELSSLESFCGTKLAFGDPFLTLKVGAPQAQPVLRDRDLPLILQKGIGRGQTLFTSFDATSSPFRGWPGRRLLWEKILALGPAGEIEPVFPDENRIVTFLLLKTTARFPFFYVIFSLLLGYLILITFLMKRIGNYRKQVSKTLLYLGGVIFLFSLASGGFIFFMQSPNRLSYNGILHIKSTGQQDLAQWRYHLGIYTQKDGEFRLPLGSDDWLVTGIPTENPDPGKFNSFTLHESKGERFLRFTLHRWSHRFFSLSGLWEFPAQGKAEWQDQDLMVTIENRFPLPIRNGYIYFGGRLFAFGTVGPKERLVKRLRWNANDQQDSLTPHEIEAILKSDPGVDTDSLKSGMEMELTKDLWVSLSKRNQTKRDSLVLVGRIDSLVFPETLKFKPPFGNGVAWLEWEIPLMRK
jgi:hypothetical protein